MLKIASTRVFTPNCERVEVMLRAHGGQGAIATATMLPIMQITTTLKADRKHRNSDLYSRKSGLLKPLY